MTSLPGHDPLVAFWQTAPEPDTHHLLLDLQRLNRLHQRFNRSVWAIVCGIGILFIFEETTGRIASHGVLSLIWTVGLAIGWVLQRRARINRSAAVTLDTVSFLESMISRAKTDLFVARCLYAGVPFGATAGFWLTGLLSLSVPPGVTAVGPRLNMLQTGAGIAALVIMIVAGLILARSRRLQVQALSDKLRSIKADV
jgi:hypothetical protein